MNGTCSICGRNKSRTFTKKMEDKQSKFKKGEKFQKPARCKNNHSSPISNLSWCDLNNKQKFT